MSHSTFSSIAQKLIRMLRNAVELLYFLLDLLRRFLVIVSSVTSHSLKHIGFHIMFAIEPINAS